ncbi:indole-3-glycerol-phosphate synthase TrpC, partial [Microcoleus sp. HI-ES]|nr:indole-3-glycerol-phosphate synthase TrpC [Microcoleus sp. HI-ES]MCZ0904586.1 indole-3-glycerol-phosphate synthase TrpC [Microcoleus sp. HI-ES]
LTLEGVNLIGINNRNLADFSVSLETTSQLLASRQTEIQAKGILIVSESGIHTPDDLAKLASAGAEAVLIGESLVKQPDPGAALASLADRPPSL